MPAYADMTTEELAAKRDELMREYEAIKAKGLALNMARGKPSSAQLDLSMPMLASVTTYEDCLAEDGTDCRNYGVLDGIPEAKRLMASMLDDDADHVIVFGSSSLNIMYDTMARCWSFGTLGHTPWSKLDEVKWLCPCPGYDRHFGVTEAFGFTMIPVTMTADGPDMDEVERLVANNASVKGIWCVPKYSNPGGVTYSDEVVRRLAAMPCAAEDFRIFWDNAYGIHHLYDAPEQQDQLLDIRAACDEAGNPDRCFKFASTSKVTFPGSGIAAVAASAADADDLRAWFGVERVCCDKITQLAHARWLPNAAAVRAHMAEQARVLRPRFELVERKLTEGLGELGCATWSHPKGGYFVSFDGPEGSAKAIVSLAAELGVKMTGAGATWPYGRDPRDTNIRIAPSYPTLDDLSAALDVFVACVRLVSARLARAKRA